MFIVTLYIGLGVVIAYCFFTMWLFGHWPIRLAKKEYQASEIMKDKPYNLPTIDIVLSVRNEPLLERTINSLAQQDYPADHLGLIIVDDFTNDERSLSVLNQIEQKKWPIALQIIRLHHELSASYANLPNKKRALTIGAKASRASFLAFTDGDCIAQPGWLKGLTREINRDNQCKMVLAGIKPINRGGFVRHFAMMEQAALTVLSGASLMAGLPLMANGANLLISRQVFEEIKAFYPWEGKPSGDDIVLLQKVHGKYPNDIVFCFHPNAIMKTKFPSDLRTFWNQRRRWASKTFTMPSKQITAVMMLMFFTQLFVALFFGVISISLYNQDLNYVGITCTGVFIKTLVDGILIFYGAKYVQYPLKFIDILLMPFFQVINVLYNLVLGLQSIVSNGKGYLWKGRRVNTKP